MSPDADTKPDVMRHVGKALPPRTIIVERGPVTNFAASVTDSDPAHQVPEAASAAGLDAIPAVPTWPFVMSNWGAFPEIQPDGADAVNPFGRIVGELMAGGGLILHGEQEFIAHRAIVVGDRLNSAGSIKDITVKERGEVTMHFVTVEETWSDDEGRAVVTTVMNLIHRK